MAADNRLLIAGLVLFGSAVIARNRSADGIGISPDDLPEESEIRRSSWKSKRMQDTPRTETVVVTGRRLAPRPPPSSSRIGPDPDAPVLSIEERRRAANEAGKALVEQAAKNEVVLSPMGVKIALPPPRYEVYGDPYSIIENIKRASESFINKSDEDPSESLIKKQEDYLKPTPAEQRILTINQDRMAASMKVRMEAGQRRGSISEETIKESCLNRVPQMVGIRKLLDRPELLEPSLLSELKARWVKFQGQCIESIPVVMNRYSRLPR